MYKEILKCNNVAFLFMYYNCCNTQTVNTPTVWSLLACSSRDIRLASCVRLPVRPFRHHSLTSQDYFLWNHPVCMTRLIHKNKCSQSFYTATWIRLLQGSSSQKWNVYIYLRNYVLSYNYSTIWKLQYFILSVSFSFFIF